MVRMLYRAYDVSALLKPGAPNAVGLRLGMCKYGYLGGFCDGAHGATAACKAAIVRISVKMEDGSVKNISSTAAGWTATTTHNPVVYSRACTTSPAVASCCFCPRSFLTLTVSRPCNRSLSRRDLRRPAGRRGLVGFSLHFLLKCTKKGAMSAFSYWKSQKKRGNRPGIN